MKIPHDALGISDATQFIRCPRLFAHGMRRWTEGEQSLIIAGEMSDALAYGSAMHECAQAVVENPDLYLDDAVDVGWMAWAHVLKPEHHAELKQDVATIIDRTKEASNLRLIASEKEMSVPLFIGRAPDPKDPHWGDEQETWYNYRFKIDALYIDENDPTHYVIRDFKSYRRKKWQSDIDEDRQFTAYSWGIKQLFEGACKRVTIWVDQVKHGETFSYRTDEDEQRWKEWMISTFRAILRAPQADIEATPTLNQFCAWCPLLPDCDIIRLASDFSLSKIQSMNDDLDLDVIPFEEYTKQYEKVKLALKALEAYKDTVDAHLKSNPGEYGDMTYSVSQITTKKWNPRDVYEVVGDRVFEIAKPMTKKDVEPLLHRFPELEERASAGYGYDRLNAKPTKKVKA